MKQRMKQQTYLGRFERALKTFNQTHCPETLTQVEESDFGFRLGVAMEFPSGQRHAVRIQHRIKRSRFRRNPEWAAWQCHCALRSWYRVHGSSRF